MELYAVTVCGYRYYFLGALTYEASAAVDSFCRHMGVGAEGEAPQMLFSSLGRIRVQFPSRSPISPID